MVVVVLLSLMVMKSFKVILMAWLTPKSEFKHKHNCTWDPLEPLPSDIQEEKALSDFMLAGCGCKRVVVANSAVLSSHGITSSPSGSPVQRSELILGYLLAFTNRSPACKVSGSYYHQGKQVCEDVSNVAWYRWEKVQELDEELEGGQLSTMHSRQHQEEASPCPHWLSMLCVFCSTTPSKMACFCLEGLGARVKLHRHQASSTSKSNVTSLSCVSSSLGGHIKRPNKMNAEQQSHHTSPLTVPPLTCSTSQLHQSALTETLLTMPNVHQILSSRGQSPRKCTIFGVNCEAIPHQINFLADEAGDGANAVISRLHFFLTITV